MRASIIGWGGSASLNDHGVKAEMRNENKQHDGPNDSIKMDEKY